MFKRKTVFVVGAGGSYGGLPTGDKLAIKISEKLAGPNRDSARPLDEQINECLHKLASANGDRNVGPWYIAASAISHSMPLALSIDNYLHTHSDDARIVQVGKLAIARCILEAEGASDVSSKPNTPFDFTGLHTGYRNLGRTPSWHNTFFKMLTEGVKRSSLESVFDNISIITFNYDRCIEHYLTHAFSQFMGMPLPDAAELCSKLEVIHPYGKVGYLLERSGTTAFGLNVSSERLLEVSRQIRTFTEQVTEEDTLALMRDRLSEAKNIVFLGFSFGDMNIKLLQAGGAKEEKNVVGSALGISLSNREHIDSELRKALKLAYKIHLPVYLEVGTCHQVLNDYSRLLLS